MEEVDQVLEFNQNVLLHDLQVGLGLLEGGDLLQEEVADLMHRDVLELVQLGLRGVQVLGQDFWIYWLGVS